MPVTPSGAAAGEDEEELAVLRQQFAAARSGQVAGSGANAVATNAMHRAATADAIDPRLSPPLSGTTAAASVLVVPGSAGLAAAGPLGATMPAASGGAASGGVASGGVASGIAAATAAAATRARAALPLAAAVAMGWVWPTTLLVLLALCIGARLVLPAHLASAPRLVEG